MRRKEICLLEHGDEIRFPDGGEYHFAHIDYDSKNQPIYSLGNWNGLKVVEGTIDKICAFIPQGSTIIMRNVPWATKKIKPVLIEKENVQMQLF